MLLVFQIAHYWPGVYIEKLSQTYTEGIGYEYDNVAHYRFSSKRYECGQETHVNNNSHFTIIGLVDGARKLEVKLSQTGTSRELIVSPCLKCFEIKGDLIYP